MKEHIKKIASNPLISGSSVILAGSLLGNLLNFLFNLFMTRNLSVVDYGILASLISIMTISTLPAGSFLPMVINFASSYFARNEYYKIRGLFLKVIKLSGSLGIVVFLIFTIFSKTIGEFFNIHDVYLITITSVIVLIGYIGTVNIAFLQAKLAFKFISSINILATFLKLSIGAIMVMLGFKVGGAMLGLFFAALVPYILSFIPLQFVLKKEVRPAKINLKEIIGYGAPSALAIFGVTAFISTDILLVKHFFLPKEAGIYAGLSLVGRVIYFFSAPIGTVMFPLVVQKKTKQENYHGVFLLAVLLVLLPSVVLILFYFLFPEFIIRFFIKNEEYLASAAFLGFFGIFITIYSLLSILVNFYLSINETKVWIPIVTGAILQALFIWFYHETFFQIIIISVTLSCLLLVGLLIYYVWRYGKQPRK